MTDEQRQEVAARVLAEMAARREVRQQIKRQQGWHKLSQISAGVLSRLAREYLGEHPELIRQALADPIIAELGEVRRWRKP